MRRGWALRRRWQPDLAPADLRHPHIPVPAPCSATPVPGHPPVPAPRPPVKAASSVPGSPPVPGPFSKRDHCPGRPIHPSRCTALPAPCGPRLTTALAGVQGGPPIAVWYPDLLQGVLGQFPWGRHPGAGRRRTAWLPTPGSWANSSHSRLRLAAPPLFTPRRRKPTSPQAPPPNE